MKKNIIGAMGALSLLTGMLVGTYAYYTYNEEIVNQIQIIIPTTRSLATLSNATLSNATSSNWGDTDLDNDELEWLQGNNIELIDDIN